MIKLHFILRYHSNEVYGIKTSHVVYTDGVGTFAQEYGIYLLPNECI